MNIKVSKIKAVLESVGMMVKDIHAEEGPAATLFEIMFQDQVALKDVVALRTALELSMNAIRIRLVQLQDSVIGLEIPNWQRRDVSFNDIILQSRGVLKGYELPMAIGETFGGRPALIDLATSPHLLCAGAVKQGKSVLVKTLISSLFLVKQPDELQLFLFDPRMVNLTEFKDVAKIFNYPEQSVWALKAIHAEMVRRYELLFKKKVTDISKYNAVSAEHLPYIVIVIDELADYVLPHEIELFGRSFRSHLISIAQLGRAVGVHIVAVTQRPSTEVINACIKTNFPTRLAFRTISEKDSFTIIDSPDASKLIGRGDMLLSNAGKLIRVQGGYMSDEELSLIVNDAYSRGYRSAQLSSNETPTHAASEINLKSLDERFADVAGFVIDKQNASVSVIQRAFGIGYAKAMRIIDQLEYVGVVGPLNSGISRPILLKSRKDLDDLLDKLRLS